MYRFSHFQRHLDSHTAYKRHVCVVCQQRFHRKDNLKSHMKIHNKPMPTSQRFQDATHSRQLVNQQLMPTSQIFRPLTSQQLGNRLQQFVINGQSTGLPAVSLPNNFVMSNPSGNWLNSPNNSRYHPVNRYFDPTITFNPYLNNQMRLAIIRNQFLLNYIQQISTLSSIYPFSYPNFNTQQYVPGNFQGFRPLYQAPVTTNAPPMHFNRMIGTASRITEVPRTPENRVPEISPSGFSNGLTESPLSTTQKKEEKD